MRYSYLPSVLAVVLIVGVSGCAAISGLGPRQAVCTQPVPQPEIPAPARIAVERLTAGGEISVLKQKKVDGEAIYRVEARVGEKDVEYDVASDGTVLAVAEGVTYTSLPGGVLATIQRYFGAVAGLKVSREAKHGQIFYKVKNKTKGNAVVTLKLTDAGRIIAREKS